MRVMRHRHVRFAAVVLLSIRIAASRAEAAEYHLATTGDDANIGTAEASFGTLRKGISVLKPGDSGRTLSNNFTGDPKFVDSAAGDFHLQEGSPAIDQGVDLREQGVRTDFEGDAQPLGNAFDVGADEFRRPREGRAAEMKNSAVGPLQVHPTNPRYFTNGARLPDGSLKAVYLTGSHTWANLIDRGTNDPPPVFDFGGYLDFLEKHNHNFIRLWGRQVCWYEKYGDEALHAAPLAWERTGPGKALDGKPKFDLTIFDRSYFQRLRSRVQAARERGIYVSIMLFGGYQEAGPNWTGSPFHRDNNVNGIDGDPNQDGSGWETQILSEIPKSVAETQKAYVGKVIDTVNDLDNVLFEISNESDRTSQDWQYDVIRFVRDYEKSKPKQHPVGMTAGYWPADENRATLDSGPAEWVSYLFEMKPTEGQEAFDVNDPFVADGRKVSIQDSDHWWVAPIYGDAEFGRQWVWKSFCRGHNPILMEHLPPRSFVARDHPLTPDDPGYVASRRAMGQTRSFAELVNLAAMTPSGALSSTDYCLAAPGAEYLVYQPEPRAEFSVELKAGAYQCKWFSPASSKTTPAGRLKAIGGAQKLKAPFDGEAVLYLKKMESLE